MTWQTSLCNLADATGPVSHDLHNVCNGIVLQAALLSRKVSDELREDVDTMRSLALRASEILARLDAYRHELRPPVGRVDLGRSVNEVAGQLKIEGKPVRVSLPKTALIISGDESDVGRLIELLARNAHRAVAAAKGDGVVTVTVEAETDTVRLTVQDTGPKATQDRLDDFFDPSIPPRTGENSLERAVCHVLVTRLGGTIRASNLPRRGVSIVVELPPADGST